MQALLSNQRAFAAPRRPDGGSLLQVLAALHDELVLTQQLGYGVDNEEFLPGLMCVAVLVPSTSGRSNLCVAVQAPIMRLTPDKALGLLPALQRAADALSRIEQDASDTLDGGALG